MKLSVWFLRLAGIQWMRECSLALIGAQHTQTQAEHPYPSLPMAGASAPTGDPYSEWQLGFCWWGLLRIS